MAIVIYSFYFFFKFFQRRTDSLKRETLKQSETRSLVFISVLSFSLTIFSYLANLPFSNDLHRAVNERFYIQPNILVFLLSGISLNELTAYLSLKLNRKSFNVIFCCLCSVLLYFLAQQISRNFVQVDRSDDYFMENYAKAVLSSVNNNSLLITQYDQQWTLIRYLLKCTSYLQRQKKQL